MAYNIPSSERSDLPPKVGKPTKIIESLQKYRCLVGDISDRSLRKVAQGQNRWHRYQKVG